MAIRPGNTYSTETAACPYAPRNSTCGRCARLPQRVPGSHLRPQLCRAKIRSSEAHPLDTRKAHNQLGRHTINSHNRAYPHPSLPTGGNRAPLMGARQVEGREVVWRKGVRGRDLHGCAKSTELPPLPITTCNDHCLARVAGEHEVLRCSRPCPHGQHWSVRA